jgi:hypothetical protein
VTLRERIGWFILGYGTTISLVSLFVLAGIGLVTVVRWVF